MVAGCGNKCVKYTFFFFNFLFFVSLQSSAVYFPRFKEVYRPTSTRGGLGAGLTGSQEIYARKSQQLCALLNYPNNGSSPVVILGIIAVARFVRRRF
jgi:hypothetical protein